MNVDMNICHKTIKETMGFAELTAAGNFSQTETSDGYTQEQSVLNIFSRLNSPTLDVHMGQL